MLAAVTSVVEKSQKVVMIASEFIRGASWGFRDRL